MIPLEIEPTVFRFAVRVPGWERRQLPRDQPRHFVEIRCNNCNWREVIARSQRWPPRRQCSKGPTGICVFTPPRRWRPRATDVVTMDRVFGVPPAALVGAAILAFKPKSSTLRALALTVLRLREDAQVSDNLPGGDVQCPETE